MKRRGKARGAAANGGRRRGQEATTGHAPPPTRYDLGGGLCRGAGLGRGALPGTPPPPSPFPQRPEKCRTPNRLFSAQTHCGVLRCGVAGTGGRIGPQHPHFSTPNPPSTPPSTPIPTPLELPSQYPQYPPQHPKLADSGHPSQAAEFNGGGRPDSTVRGVRDPPRCCRDPPQPPPPPQERGSAGGGPLVPRDNAGGDLVATPEPLDQGIEEGGDPGQPPPARPGPRPAAGPQHRQPARPLEGRHVPLCHVCLRAQVESGGGWGVGGGTWSRETPTPWKSPPPKSPKTRGSCKSIGVRNHTRSQPTEELRGAKYGGGGNLRGGGQHTQGRH